MEESLGESNIKPPEQHAAQFSVFIPAGICVFPMSRLDLLKKTFQDILSKDGPGDYKLSEELRVETVDSGFLSGSNIIVSEEVSERDYRPYEGEKPRYEEAKQAEEAHMHIDSGVDLSEKLSNLSLKHPELNDLNRTPSSKTSKPPCITKTNEKEQQQQPWEIYFEQDEDGDTQLHIAIIQEFPEVALALIRLAPHPRFLDTPNDDAQSPLHLAVATGQARVARTLIVAGARPSSRNLLGDSPLHIAARTGDISCCRAITDPVHQQERDALALTHPPQSYQSPNLDQWNYDGQTCVHVAAIHGHVEVLRHLVWNGADINSREGTMGYTALHCAIARADERLIHFLLTECTKLSPDTVTYGGRSALELGQKLPSSLVNVLLARGVPSPSPYSSDDEAEDSSSEDEMVYENNNTNIYVPNFVNASA